MKASEYTALAESFAVQCVGTNINVNKAAILNGQALVYATLAVAAAIAEADYSADWRHANPHTPWHGALA